MSARMSECECLRVSVCLSDSAKVGVCESECVKLCVKEWMNVWEWKWLRGVCIGKCVKECVWDGMWESRCVWKREIVSFPVYSHASAIGWAKRWWLLCLAAELEFDLLKGLPDLNPTFKVQCQPESELLFWKLDCFLSSHHLACNFPVPLEMFWFVWKSIPFHKPPLEH